MKLKSNTYYPTPWWRSPYYQFVYFPAISSKLVFIGEQYFSGYSAHIESLDLSMLNNRFSAQEI